MHQQDATHASDTQAEHRSGTLDQALALIDTVAEMVGVLHQRCETADAYLVAIRDQSADEIGRLRAEADRWRAAALDRRLIANRLASEIVELDARTVVAINNKATAQALLDRSKRAETETGRVASLHPVMAGTDGSARDEQVAEQSQGLGPRLRAVIGWLDAFRALRLVRGGASPTSPRVPGAA